MQLQTKIKESEWLEWCDNAVTQYFFEFLRKEANANRQMMGLGGCIGEGVLDTGQKYLLSNNTAQVYERLIAVEYSDTVEENEDGNTTSGASTSN